MAQLGLVLITMSTKVVNRFQDLILLLKYAVCAMHTVHVQNIVTVGHLSIRHQLHARSRGLQSLVEFFSQIASLFFSIKCSIYTIGHKIHCERWQKDQK